ncbi:glycosyltransferase family 76 protein [Mycena amicta]|nr:glycosyltransferase family 76 protein [Mycena amicta]
MLALGVLLLALVHLFPPFDAATPSLLLRWDVVHFVHIARSGYVYEHEWAFFPAVPALLSIFRFAPTLLSFALAWDMYKTMYSLSLHHLQSPALAQLAAWLSLLPSSPATLFVAPYSEPFFTYFSYKGMLFCAQSRYLLAALSFTLAATCRANGFTLSGFIISFSSITACIALAALPLVPFAAHNYAAYVAFCPSAPWCTGRLPLVFSHAQSQYWNVGLFRYWTLQQLPNILIALPPLLAIGAFSLKYLYRWLQFDSPGSVFLSPSIAPHAIHALLMCAIYIFASHTQIVLRQAASLPITYWAASWLLVKHPKWGRAWVAWSLLWGTLSTILWGA